MAIKQIVQQNGKVFSWNEKAITHKDYDKIMHLLREDVGKAHVSPSSLHRLYLFAVNSVKYDSNDIPKDVVTLNSEVLLANADHQRQLVKIVLPEKIHGRHDISVYSLLGLACIGSRESECLQVQHHNSKQKLFVEKIMFQPEKENVPYL
ncbi:GreA/GreB family elongation factor [Saccharicrinis fermentans]|uniref:Nucleoside diphosphate kinase regulator n=1 Tax=Saccharicrinis fermentans DSM 9555 = JCM 21142 TaxID=869213 RepID=W7YKW4_9BACT|nr:GreA/GreB family elongation factor [Saccharicrinis fermentans]GAF02999.1 nucleoside diphosphate kinase regulator [Saccharicrinis fermentans DSM 9555 = JCM 21142]